MSKRRTIKVLELIVYFTFILSTVVFGATIPGIPTVLHSYRQPNLHNFLTYKVFALLILILLIILSLVNLILYIIVLKKISKTKKIVFPIVFIITFIWIVILGLLLKSSFDVDGRFDHCVLDPLEIYKTKIMISNLLILGIQIVYFLQWILIL